MFVRYTFSITIISCLFTLFIKFKFNQINKRTGKKLLYLLSCSLEKTTETKKKNVKSKCIECDLLAIKKKCSMSTLRQKFSQLASVILNNLFCFYFSRGENNTKEILQSVPERLVEEYLS